MRPLGKHSKLTAQKLAARVWGLIFSANPLAFCGQQESDCFAKPLKVHNVVAGAEKHQFFEINEDVTSCMRDFCGWGIFLIHNAYAGHDAVA